MSIRHSLNPIFMSMGGPPGPCATQNPVWRGTVLGHIPLSLIRSGSKQFSFSNFYLGLSDFDGSAGPDDGGEAGEAVLSRVSLAGNVAASFTIAAARSLLMLQAGS